MEGITRQEMIEQRAEQAMMHVEYMQDRYAGQIQASISETTMHAAGNGTYTPNVTKQMVFASDTVEALMFAREQFPDKKIAVVNFANYFVPGGGFMNGAIAQEEALCHESTLYNVLAQKQDWYASHKDSVSANSELYSNQALYIPEVYFERERVVTADVITVAAPNANAFTGDAKMKKWTIKSRIEFIRDIAREHKVDVLIFGAFGCGAFGNDPDWVAKVSVNVFNNCGIPVVAYAIPDQNSKNFLTFNRIVSAYQEVQIV